MSMQSAGIERSGRFPPDFAPLQPLIKINQFRQRFPPVAGFAPGSGTAVQPRWVSRKNGIRPDMTIVHAPTAEPALLAGADYAIPVAGKERLALPAGVRPFRLNWPYIIGIAAYHAAAVAGLHARLFQLERPDPGDARHPSVRAVRHQPLLPPAADPSRPEMPKVAGACDGGRRDVLPAGDAGALGRDPPPAPSIRRRSARPAQPAGQFLLGPYRLDPGASARTRAAGYLPALCQGHPARPLLCRAGAPQLAGLDQPDPDAAVLRRRIRWRHGCWAPPRQMPCRPA